MRPEARRGGEAAVSAAAGRDPVRAIADAVLYEGYVLWPYSRSATKNQRRWTFGGVYPEAHSRGRNGDDPWEMRTECLLEAEPGCEVDVSVRFLHVVSRQVLRQGSRGLEPVDELEVDGDRFLSWDEATEREVTAPGLRPVELASRHGVPIEVPAGREEERLADGRGRAVGAVVREWEPLRGTLEVSATEIGPGLFRLAARVENRSPWDSGDREDALRRTFCSTHTVLTVRGGAFASLTDPPEHLRDAAEACRNEGTWPVLVGEEGSRDRVLSSPIILEDHPKVAPESPGDLFDGGEIDQLLTLNILSLTDEEKAEMRAADPRTREILERTEALSEQELMRLHGTIREFQAVRR